MDVRRQRGSWGSLGVPCVPELFETHSTLRCPRRADSIKTRNGTYFQGFQFQLWALELIWTKVYRRNVFVVPTKEISPYLLFLLFCWGFDSDRWHVVTGVIVCWKSVKTVFFMFSVLRILLIPSGLGFVRAGHDTALHKDCFIFEQILQGLLIFFCFWVDD